MHNELRDLVSEEGSQEVLAELARPPEDTPERRRTFAGARFMAEWWKRKAASAEAHDADGTPKPEL